MQFIGSEHFALLYQEDGEHISYTTLWDLDTEEVIYQATNGGNQNGK